MIAQVLECAFRSEMKVKVNEDNLRTMLTTFISTEQDLYLIGIHVFRGNKNKNMPAAKRCLLFLILKERLTISFYDYFLKKWD